VHDRHLIVIIHKQQVIMFLLGAFLEPAPEADAETVSRPGEGGRDDRGAVERGGLGIETEDLGALGIVFEV
jgi:hypothetical protein